MAPLSLYISARETLPGVKNKFLSLRVSVCECAPRNRFCAQGASFFSARDRMNINLLSRQERAKTHPSNNNQDAFRDSEKSAQKIHFQIIGCADKQEAAPRRSEKEFTIGSGKKNWCPNDRTDLKRRKYEWYRCVQQCSCCLWRLAQPVSSLATEWLARRLTS